MSFYKIQYWGRRLGYSSKPETIVKVQAKRATGGLYYYINLPKIVVEALNIQKGDYLRVKVDGDRVIIRKINFRR